jgi:hypothetical protein
VVSVWTPLSQHQVAERWFSFPNLLILSPVPLLVAASAFWLLWSLGRASNLAAVRRRAGPGAAGLYGHGDQHLAAHRAARHHDLGSGGAAGHPDFALVGTLIVLPLILAYTGWAYFVFRGKVGRHRGVSLMNTLVDGCAAWAGCWASGWPGWRRWGSRLAVAAAHARGRAMTRAKVQPCAPFSFPGTTLSVQIC